MNRDIRDSFYWCHEKGQSGRNKALLTTRHRELSQVSGKTHLIQNNFFETIIFTVAHVLVVLFGFVLFPLRFLVFQHCSLDLIGAVSATSVVIT